MKRIYWNVNAVAPALVIMVALCGVGCQIQQSDLANSKLAGSRCVIDAGDYPILQAAFDALPKAGGVVRIPPGTYEIKEPLEVTKGDVFIEGAGTATHIKNVNTNGEPAIIVQGPPRGEGKKPACLWRICLANFRVTGNEKSGAGIKAWRINEIFVDGVTVSYHGGDGILLEACGENPRISDSLITYNKKTGLNMLGCHDMIVSANQFEENCDAVRCIDCWNLTMTGNNLDDQVGNGVVIENTYGSVVSGNMIEECRGAGIILGRDCYGITLSANVIAGELSEGIDLRDAHGCAVSANTFTIARSSALRIGPRSGRITVTGNNFSDSYVGEGEVKRPANDLYAGGLVICGTSDVVISGNIFSGVRPKALAVEGEISKRILFSNNLIVDADSDHTKLDESSLIKDNLQSGTSADKP